MQNNKILYIDFNRGTLTNTEMARVIGYPELIYGSAPIWEIHFVVSDGDGGSVGADLSDATAWHAAVDLDFTQSTTPMVRTLDPDIDHSGAASGVIVVPLNCLTETFLAKVDNRQSIPAYFELRGLDENDKTIYCWQLRINALGAVDAEGGEPIPVASGGVTLSDVYAVVRQTPLLQYSANGTSWHDTQINTDKLARVSVSGGQWSDAIMLPSGVQGPEGPAGAEISSIIVTTLPSYEPASADFADGTLSLGIPSGAPGANGLNGDTITGLVVNMIPTNEPPSASFVGGLETLWIPSGAQGPKGEDGSAITGVVVNTLPDTAQASASFIDGLLSFGIPSGTPGEDGNPDAVTAVDALPTASSATTGKAYLVKTTGHTWVGISQTEETTTETQVYPTGYSAAVTAGSDVPQINGCTFTEAGTYTCADGTTVPYYSTTGTDGFGYFLADYYNTSYSKKTVIIVKGDAPSTWDANTIFGIKAWSPTNWKAGGKTMSSISSITSWYWQDDNEEGTKYVTFTLNLPAGAYSKINLSGFSSTDANGLYAPTGESVTVSTYYGTFTIPTYSNGTCILKAVNNPQDSMTIVWSVFNGSTSRGFTSNSWSDGDTMTQDLAGKLAGSWYVSMPDTFNVTAAVTYWVEETVIVTTYSFEDITPSDADGFNSWVQVSEDSVIQMQPDRFYRYEGTGTAANAYFVPLAGAAASKSWHCTLSFNGNACLSGGSFTIFRADGQPWHGVSSSETWLIPSAGLYDFWWFTTSTGQPSAYVKPIGFFTF